MEQYNLKYIPAEAIKNKNIFLEEFYTSVDTDIYINNEKCDLINSIQYSMQEQLHPIYGYNSFTYDDVSIGNRIITGSIRIPVSNYDNFIKNFTSTSSDYKQDYNNSEESNSDNADTNVNTKPDWVTESYGSGSSSSSMPFSLLVKELYNNDNIITSYNIKALYAQQKSNFLNNSIPSNLSSSNGTVLEEDNNLITPIDDLDEIYSKPKYTRDISPFFKESYSKSNFSSQLEKGEYRHNYSEISIKIGNTSKKTLKYVIFRSLDGYIDAEGDPLFETLQFIARDLIEESLLSQ